MTIFKVILISISAISALTACTINVNQANSNENANMNANAVATPDAPTPMKTVETKVRWSVVVCSSRAKNVTLSAGSNEDDSEVFATWKEESAQRKFDLPARVQNLTSIFFMSSASDKNQVELCVLFDGKPKKRIEFDDSEDHVINSSDSDDNDCRCTQ